MDTTNRILLENGNLCMAFDGDTGALCRLSSPLLDWALFAPGETGLSFQLLVPLGEERRNNKVFGERQRLSSARLGPDGRSLELVWDGVVSEQTGPLAIRVTETIRLEGDEAIFRLRIENHTPYVVESAGCPCLANLLPPGRAGWLKAFHYSYASAREANLRPNFQNQLGYFGFDYPEQYYGFSPDVPFVLFLGEGGGLSAGVRDDRSEIVAWNVELRPGWESSIDGRLPAGDTLAGVPVQTRFTVLHMPYVQPGETRDLTPIALQAFRGGWREGTELYRIWLDTWLVPRLAPQWAAEPHAWQQLHINSPEDELRLRYTDLPAVAAECARNGVRAIQLVGWNQGGQDQGNPSHDTDPRLGTFEELRDAIAACQRLGVRIILFSKFTWADRATEWFRRELHAYAVRDPYGDEYVYGGYQYQTPAQMLDINTKRLIPMCFLSDAYRELARQEFLKLVALGADGMLFDECQHHSPTRACFSPLHGHRPGAPTYRNDRLLIREMRDLPQVPEDFLMAGEACYAWEMEQYQVAYHRSESLDHIPLGRCLLPRAQLMTAVTGFHDRNMINQCLMYRYIVSYEPYNFKGRLADFPDTVAYGRRMDETRTELRKWFWDGEYRHTDGVGVMTAAGQRHSPYAVFRAADGSLGVVITNYGDEAIAVRLESPDRPLARYRLVDSDVWRDAGEIGIPPRSAAVVM